MKYNHFRHRYGYHQSIRSFGQEDAIREPFHRHHRGDSRGGFGGRGEGRRRFFERGEFKFALLELLAAEPMHGYQLIKAMEERTGGLYTPSAGSVYPNLQLLEDMNLIDFIDQDGKKLYRITEEGRAHLRERKASEPEPSENRWERRGRHRAAGDFKHGLRGLMKEWSDVIYLLARAAQTAQEDPSSERAAQFRERMTKLRQELKAVLNEEPKTDGDSNQEDPGSEPQP